MVAGPALVVWCALVPFAVGSPQEDPAAVPRAQVQRILAQGGYQQTPPSEVAADSQAENGSDEPGAGRRRTASNDSSRRRRDRTGPLSAPLVVPIVVGSILLLLLLLGITRRGGLAAERRSAEVVAPEPMAQTAAPPEPVTDPERLAAEGRFADAVHSLLLRALRGLARSLGGIARGLTSREILPRAPEGAARAALQELVATVERHQFGAHELGADDFARCRAAAGALHVESTAEVEAGVTKGGA
jgi:hypothetical protein